MQSCRLIASNFTNKWTPSKVFSRILPSFLPRAPTCSQHLWETLYILKLSIDFYVGNFWAVLELVVLSGVSSIEFFHYRVLDFLSDFLFFLAHIHYHLNVQGTMHHQLLIVLISSFGRTWLFVLVSCSASCSVKIQNCWLILPYWNLLNHTIAVFLCLAVSVFLWNLYIQKKYLKNLGRILL